MRVVSHTCSNTEIVCALGAADRLIAIDSDSDFPPEVVGGLVQLGRDLQLDVEAALALQPDLVLSSLTVPGHERIVDAFHAAGVPTVVCNPQNLDDVFGDIRRIAQVLGIAERGEQLVAEMLAAMPPHTPTADAPRVLVEWWPKPVIGAARRSWVHDLIERAGGRNALGERDAQTHSYDTDAAPDAVADVIAMSWCGVKVDKYRADVVLHREHWQDVPAVRDGRIVAISEEFLGRPGPRLVEGYRQLRAAIKAKAP
ncbi:ABC transporter substrate-binding protein [Solimonas marina]|uniref:ABC transporter substrate-binding protein n=1 Tax=Solimonas marina TaxID=2714601 RepID=A0A969WAB9_9GAMM|nr:helical backbone metal receptor [Solimonas marina]NKF22918.1 ABC transporter substrate-binding protein [Solimonas marina]